MLSTLYLERYKFGGSYRMIDLIGVLTVLGVISVLLTPSRSANWSEFDELAEEEKGRGVLGNGSSK